MPSLAAALRSAGTAALLALAILLLPGCGGKSGAPLVGIITNYGANDVDLAQLKGAIYSVNAKARVADLVLGVGSGEVRQAAFLVDQTAASFPEGVVFVIALGPDAKGGRPAVLVATKAKKYYLAPDTGLLSYVIAREGLDRAWLLDKTEYYRPGAGPVFRQGSDVLAPIAGQLTLSLKPEALGTPTKTVETIPVDVPHVAGQNIGGSVVHVDDDGNLITNIPPRFAPWMKEGNLLKFTINKEAFAAPLVDSLVDIKVGRPAALYTPQGRLEIVVNKGSAARIYGAAVGDSISIRP